MPKYIETPSGIAEFPDGMEDAAIESVLRSQFKPSPEASAAKGLARAVLGQQFRPPAMPKAPAAPVLADPDVKALAPLPDLPKPAVPFMLRNRAQRGDIGDVGMAMGDTGEGMRRMAEFQTAGAKEAAAGAGQMVAPNQPLERRVMGASRAFRGGMQAALPAMLPIMGAAAMAAPAATAFGMVAGTAAQEGVERGAKAMGVPEGYARVAGDLAGLPGYMYGPFRALRPKVPTTTGVVDDAIAPPPSIADDVPVAAPEVEARIPEVDAPVSPTPLPPKSPVVNLPGGFRSYTAQGFETSGAVPQSSLFPFTSIDKKAGPKSVFGPPTWKAVKAPKAKPDAAPAGKVASTPEQAAASAADAGSPQGAALGSLAGAKPSYGFGEKRFSLEFENDADLAAYIASSKKPSKNAKKYLEFAQSALGTDADGVKSHGAALRESIKGIARDAESGTAIRVPSRQTPDAPTKRIIPEPTGDAPVRPDAADVAPQPQPSAQPATAPATVTDTLTKLQDGADAPVPIGRLRDAGVTDDQILEAWSPDGIALWESHLNAGHPDVKANPKDFLIHEGRAYNVAVHHPDAPSRRDTQRGSFSRKPVSNIDTGDRIDFPVAPDEVPEKGKTLFQQVYTAADKATTNMLDRMHPVKVLEHARAILDSEGNVSGVRREMKSGISADDSGYAHARSFSGHEGQVLDDMIRLERIVRSAPKKKFVVDGKKRQFLDVADAYAMLERHEEKFLADAADVADLTAKATAGDVEAAAALKDHKPYTAPKYANLAEVQAAKAQFEQQFASEMPEIKRLNDEFRAEDDRLLQAWRDSGLGTQEWYDATKARNQMYVPFQRIKHLADNLESMPTGGKVMSVGSDTFMHRMEGSEDAVMSPLASRIRNRTILRKLIARNDTAKRVGALAKNPEYKGLVMPLKSGQKVESGFDKISFIENGVKQEVAVPVEVAEALKTSENLDLLTKAMSVPARVLRAGVTIAPNFMIRNAIRDYQTAVGAARLEGLGFTPVDWAKGFLGAMMRGVPEGKGFKIGGQVFDERMYREFLQSKGAFGGFYHHGDLAKTAAGMTKSRTAKVLKTVANPIEMARIFGETVELAPRIGVMQKAGEQGASKFEAGMKAREGTVDFEMRGAAMRAVSAIVPFLNPRIQGVSNLYRAAKERPARTLTRLSVQVGIPWMAAYAWNRQHFDKEYDSISPYEKRGHLIWIYGDGRDADGNLTEAFKIPKGEVGPFLNTLEDMADYMKNKKPREWKAMIAETMSDLSPIPFAEEGSVSARPAVSMLAPPPVKAGFEWLSNQNTFTGRDIVPAEMKNAEPWNQFKPGTPEYLKWLGKKTNLSPAKMQNTLGTMGGYIGRAASEPGKAKRVLFGDQTVRVEPADKGRALSVNKEQSRDANLRVSATRLARENFGRIHGAKTSADRKAAFSEGIEAMRRDFPNEAEKELRTRYLRALDTEYKRQFPERKTPDSDPREVPLNAYERKMKGLSTQARARTLVTELDGMAPAERKEKWRRWKAIGIVTEKVIEEMRKTR